MLPGAKANWRSALAPLTVIKIRRVPLFQASGQSHGTETLRLCLVQRVGFPLDIEGQIPPGALFGSRGADRLPAREFNRGPVQSAVSRHGSLAGRLAEKHFLYGSGT